MTFQELTKLMQNADNQSGSQKSLQTECLYNLDWSLELSKKKQVRKGLFFKLQQT